MLMPNKDVSSYNLQGQHKGADKVIQVLLKRTFLSFARFVRLDGLNAEFPFTIQREMPEISRSHLCGCLFPSVCHSAAT